MTEEEIKSLWLQANERITELLILTTALQTLLQQAGVFSKEAVDKRVAELQTLFDERYRHHLLEERGRRFDEQLQQLLEGFEGTKQ